jgi:ferredoxin-NADP reductase
MATNVIKLVSREEIAADTMSFHFEKPAGFQFKPGQYLDCTLTNPRETDAEGNIRSFSIASAPAEPHLMLATRMRDTAFKRVLKTMPIGSPLSVEGPMGSFTLHNNTTRPAILIAGGIGITPFRSMIVNAARTKLAPRIVLLYSNHRPEDAAFLDELQKLGSENKNFKLIAVMTDMQKSKRTWSGETSKLDKAFITRHVPDLNGPIFYVAGPPAMVNGMKSTLIDTGVNEDDIRAEDFAGY